MMRTLLLLLASLLVVAPASAQWTNRTILLRPGWNAIFLAVQPEPRDCDAIFAGVPVESVWSWNRRFTPVQFIQDPGELLPGQPDWLTYVPPSHPARATMNLFTLEANRAYLIKLPDTATPVSWSYRGRPLVRRLEWLADSFNLTGFHVDPANPPTFQNFFASSPAHAGQRAYRLVNGAWSQVSSPASTRLAPDEAYWIFCRGQSSYVGPMEVAVEQGYGLDYDRALSEQTLTLRNRGATSNTFTVRPLVSAAPSDPAAPLLAGPVPLASFRLNITPSQIESGWVPMLSPVTMALGPGQEWNLRLEVRRAEMAPFTPPPGGADALYQSLLELSDGAGSRSLVGVTSRGLQATAAAGGSAGFRAAGAAAPASIHPRAGLWVGSVALSQVSQPAAAASPDAPRRTASDFQFRLLIHVDESGQARLLQKVIQMWKDGTVVTDTNGLQVTDTPGRFVLVTDDRFIPDFTGATLRDGQPVGHRLSSAAFGFRTPVPMTGDFGSTNGLLQCAVTLDYDDELNPFKHRYHPDHNNRDDSPVPQPLLVRTNAHGLRYTAESSAVRREIRLQFTAGDPEGLSLSGFGDLQLGGVYRETMTGLHKDALNVQGVFRLRLVSRVGVLNDGRP